MERRGSRGVSVLVAALLPALSAVARPQAPVAAPEPAGAWEMAKDQVHRGVLNTLAQRRAELRRGLADYTVSCGPRWGDGIALTFDDGPHPDFTPQLLAILRQQQVPATFFVVGEMAEEHPDLVQAIAADGHCLGNHTYHHTRLPGLSEGTIATEIKACGLVLQDLTGQAPCWFRPPGGESSPRVAMVARALGYRVVLWDVLPGDTARPQAGLIGGRMMGEARPGSIILLHSGVPETVEVLPWVIFGLRACGFRFVTLDELLSPTATAWERFMRDLGISLTPTLDPPKQPPVRF